MASLNTFTLFLYNYTTGEVIMQTCRYTSVNRARIGFITRVRNWGGLRDGDEFTLEIKEGDLPHDINYVDAMIKKNDCRERA